jgi:hypothetical protein
MPYAPQGVKGLDDDDIACDRFEDDYEWQSGKNFEGANRLYEDTSALFAWKV